VQALKAGILEAADIIVLNKVDRPESDGLGSELQELVAGCTNEAGWEVPVIRTVAKTGKGVEELFNSLDAFENWLNEDDRLPARRKLQVEKELKKLVRQGMIDALDHTLAKTDVQDSANRVVAGEVDLYRAVNDLVKGLAVSRKGDATPLPL
jgi:LAO/AO transport system kinase